jgi:hypothetical protein
MRSLSIQRGKSITRWCQNSTASTIWVTAATTDVPPKISSHCARSPLWEQGGSFGKAPVVDLSLSSDEGDLIADVSRDEAFSRRVFGDLNRDVLQPPGDGQIIILSDSDEEEEVCEEKVVDTEAGPSSAVRSPASTASASADADDAPTRVKNNNSDDRTPNQEVDGNNGGRDDVELL